MAEDGQQLELAREPTPDGEAAIFENSDERRLDGAHKREMEKLTQEQGVLGKFLGTTNTSLKIAFVVVTISGTGFIASLIGSIWEPNLLELSKLCGTILLTVAGYVFGVKSN